MLKIVRFIFELPLVKPIIFFYSIYATFMMVRESDITDLIEIETEEQFDSILNPLIDSFKEKYLSLLYGLNTIAWLYIIKIILTWNH